ncbi:peptidase S8 and S53 subtilisin kexin sedolisin [Thermodesulfatator indicus DSM 15286]|uniref:Peptidase S8 and S53 subtilisin kexin sedolisin n=1 Tax=Thermodesulfatator indicus (strain DSM 15286 / JCM 11887 / CIR29812) TaxID=667014 RepID=F8AAS4_THEID|nr:S8 family peptidase [Thermodesulfatator indicus]AEH45435.1 peptidase S8 and S53 subtilisin kexin sedolisin [Thermodesulfatator indicus DSM 15286]
MEEQKEKYCHLKLIREEPITERRPKGAPRVRKPDDLIQHARFLKKSIVQATHEAKKDIKGYDERLLIRLEIQEAFPIERLGQLGPNVEFVSQEGKNIVLAFASEEALAEFEARLATLAEGGRPQYLQLIYALQDIGAWTPEHRKGWALRNEGFPKTEPFILDVELWPLESSRERELQQEAFKNWCHQQGIEILDWVRDPPLFRVQVSLAQAEELLRYRDVRLVDLPPKYGLERTLLYIDIQEIPDPPPPPDTAPVIGILDSGIVSTHNLLKSAVGDVQSFLPDYPPQDGTGHGTLVAGIALYGDVEEKLRNRQFIPVFWIVSGRILDDKNENRTGFLEKHIEEAVRYFYEHYGCRIFNLSLGDRRKPYLGGHLRGLAYTLDKLARELGVLFIVSTGNVLPSQHDGRSWKENYPHYLFNDEWAILDPAPALNAITVGSIARWDQTYNSQRYRHDPAEIPIARRNQPSPFTRHGPSIGGAIKPELVAYGGNWAINVRAGSFNVLNKSQGLGELSFNKDFSTNGPFAENSGTSFSAPHVTHLAGLILSEYSEASHNLLRALLIAHADTLEEWKDLFEEEKDILKVCGYGLVDLEALINSSENDVTLIAEDRIPNKRHHFYEIPLPEDFLSPGRRIREIRVALAYTAAVRTTRISYKATRMEFRLVAAESLEQVCKEFNAATSKEELEKIGELRGAYPTLTDRSKGTVQKATWTWRQINTNSILRRKKLFVVVTRNDFPWGEAISAEEEPYALVVRIRDPQNLNARLYSQIRERIEERVRVRV